MEANRYTSPLGRHDTLQLKVGDTTLPVHEPGLNVDINETHEIEGWIPAENNIICAVKHQTNAGTVTIEVGFPKAGTVPMIIATDTTRHWMNERQEVPESWWKK